jgi:PBP1b-binding outer membrane lipoprotein LpoB
LKRNIIVSILACLLIFTLILTSCSSPPASSATPQASIFDKLAAAEARIATLEQSISDTKAKAQSAEDIAKNSEKIANAAVSDRDIQALTAKISTLESKVNSNSPVSASEIQQLKDELNALKTKESNDTSNLSNRFDEVDTELNDLTIKVAAILTVLPIPTSTITPTPTVTTGQVIANYFNSPMIFSKPAATGQAKQFGIKLTNTYTDKDLAFVNISIKMTIANLSAFEAIAEPKLESINGIFNWVYSRGAGNTVTFTSDAYVYVSANNGEFADTQKLTIYGDETTTGSYTVSINSIVINSKTMQ